MLVDTIRIQCIWTIVDEYNCWYANQIEFNVRLSELTHPQGSMFATFSSWCCAIKTTRKNIFSTLLLSEFSWKLHTFLWKNVNLISFKGNSLLILVMQTLAWRTQTFRKVMIVLGYSRYQRKRVQVFHVCHFVFVFLCFPLFSGTKTLREYRQLGTLHINSLHTSKKFANAITMRW